MGLLVVLLKLSREISFSNATAGNIESSRPFYIYVIYCVHATAQGSGGYTIFLYIRIDSELLRAHSNVYPYKLYDIIYTTNYSAVF